jgi:hypothetical protein
MKIVSLSEFRMINIGRRTPDAGRRTPDAGRWAILDVG